nr:MAG TPA: hypothetical protein [Caudoviricetes sp.]DAX21847.1 MAG TPA: hypothetical protein [Caudoviricetes sp.]
MTPLLLYRSTGLTSLSFCQLFKNKSSLTID